MKKLLNLLFIMLCYFSYSQSYKINKISVDDFKELKYQKDTSAIAVVDYNIGNTYFESVGNNHRMVTITKTRIKILKKEGFEYATVKTPLYKDASSREILSVSDAYTYNLVNGKVEKTKLKSDGEFNEKIQGNHFLNTFTMPNVKEGSIIEFTTKLTSPYFTYIPEWVFQYDIPVIYSEYSLRFPQSLIFYKYIKGTEKVVQATVGDEYYYSAKDLPALKNEGFVNNINNYRTSVIHTFSGYRDKTNTTKLVAGTWDDVVKNINENDKFGNQLKSLSFLEYFVPSIVGDKINPEDKTIAIINYVKKNYTWNKELGIYTTQSIKETFKSKTGSSADINMLTIAMLKVANVKAYPVLLATRGKGISYMPSQNAFNNVIIGVEFPKKDVLYDASDKLTNNEILPIHNLNWMGRLVRDNGTSRDVLLEPKVKSKFVISANFKLDLNGSLNGTIRKNYSNYEAYEFRVENQNKSKEEIIDNIKTLYKVEVEDYSVNNLENLDENVEEFYKINREAGFDLIGDKIYLQPLSIFSIKSNPFKAETRSYPIDFLYPLERAYTIYYNIPEGYKVDYLPTNKKIIAGNNTVILKTVFSSNDKMVQLRFNFEYTKAFVDANEYVDIKQAFEELVKFCDEKIVLKKI